MKPLVWGLEKGEEEWSKREEGLGNGKMGSGETRTDLRLALKLKFDLWTQILTFPGGWVAG